MRHGLCHIIRRRFVASVHDLSKHCSSPSSPEPRTYSTLHCKALCPACSMRLHYLKMCSRVTSCWPRSLLVGSSPMSLNLRLCVKREPVLAWKSSTLDLSLRYWRPGSGSLLCFLYSGWLCFFSTALLHSPILDCVTCVRAVFVHSHSGVTRYFAVHPLSLESMALNLRIQPVLIPRYRIW